MLLVHKEKTILNIYPYGSQVYGTANEQSDNDYIVVVEGNEGFYDQIIVEDGDCTVYDEKAFQEKIDMQELSVLECLSLPKDKVIKEDRQFDLIINIPQLRKAVSAKCSNSFAKARKKLQVEKDYNPLVAKKSLFHVMRMQMFGIQLATQGRITNFSEANYLFHEIMNIDSNDWQVFKDKYQPIANHFATEFRKVAPKGE